MFKDKLAELVGEHETFRKYTYLILYLQTKEIKMLSDRIAMLENIVKLMAEKDKLEKEGH